jgi:hypothetical protein
MSKNKSEQKVVAKKGCVINRKHNRTINQDIAPSNPKWEDVGLGVLKRKGQPNYAKVGPFGKLVPMNRHQVRFYLNSIESAKKAAEKLKTALIGDQAAE